MYELILTMIVALDKFGDSVGFTKQDIDNFISKYNLLKEKPKCNERGYIVLLNYGYITKEQFADFMDVEYRDGNYWYICNDFSDILSEKYEMEISILNADGERFVSDYYDAGIEYHWDYYNEETLQAIIDFCIKNSLEIDGELMTDKNTILKDGDIYFISEEGDSQKLNDLINDYDLKELKVTLNWSIIEVQQDADENEYYVQVKKNFEDKIGTFKYEKINNEYKLWVRLDFDIDDVEKFLKDDYGEYDFDYDDGIYGNLYYILKDMEFFDFKKPYYSYISGTIDKNYLNENTQERLSW